MKQYIDVLKKILEEGTEKESGRENMPNTFGISKSDISMDMKDGFPLLTTKKMFWKGIVHELLWFLRGETNIKYLIDNKVNIWNDDAYRWYCKKMETHAPEKSPYSYDEFVNLVKTLSYGELSDMDNCYLSGIINYRLGDLGKVYGEQWRNQNGVDQVADVVNGLKNNPYSRYHIIDGWNKADFSDMALPPCHLLYQFIVRPLTAYEREDIYAKKHGFNEEDRLGMNPNASDDDVHILMDKDGIEKFYLDLNMYQRSCDTPLGVPFNIASMSLLLLIMSKATNMIPGIANWIGGDTHIYLNQLEKIEEQIVREPMELPKMLIEKEINSLEDIENLSIDDFNLIGYKSHPSIKYELSTGAKK